MYVLLHSCEQYVPTRVSICVFMCVTSRCTCVQVFVWICIRESFCVYIFRCLCVHVCAFLPLFVALFNSTSFGVHDCDVYMSVYSCLHIYVVLCAHVYMCLCAHLSALVILNLIYICVPVCAQVFCVHVNVSMCMFGLHMCSYEHVYMCMHVCVWSYQCEYVCTYVLAGLCGGVNYMCMHMSHLNSKVFFNFWLKLTQVHWLSRLSCGWQLLMPLINIDGKHLLDNKSDWGKVEPCENK